MNETPNGSQTLRSELRAETSRCDCGTVSPPIVTDHPVLADSELVEWEASHLQWHCPIPSHGEFDDHLDIWQHAALPSFTREPAELQTTSDIPKTWHQPLKSDVAAALVASHTQEPTP